jgi:hypothetical protein
MKKLFIIAFVVSLLCAFTTAKAQPYTADLIAGQFTDVGDLLVWNDGTYLYVKYVITDPNWLLNVTHLQVSDTGISGIPQSNGNPIPGQFDYSTPDEGDSSYALYRIPLVVDDITNKKGKIIVPGHNWAVGEKLTIAAHGVVSGICGWEGFLASLSLPIEDVTACVAKGTDSYLEVTISNDGLLNGGPYKAWCVDIYTDISITCYTSSISDPNGVLPNLNQILWLINNDDGLNTADIQSAIWLLVDGDYPAGHPWDWGFKEWWDPNGVYRDWPADYAVEIARVDALVTEANLHSDFEPGCNELAILLVTPDEGEQPMIIELPVLCQCGDETIWAGIPYDDSSDRRPNGYGYDFPGNDWATYLEYYVQEED